MKEAPILDRPYERLEKSGAESLSNSELLAIIIKNGTRGNNCVDIAKNLLSIKKGGLEGFEYLKKVSIDELKTFKGIGRVKAIQIKAILELSKRIASENVNKDIKITSPKAIYDLVKGELEDEEVELLKLVLLNKKNIVKSIVTVCKGAQSRAVISMKEILNEPLKQMAAACVIVHNHPSGVPDPSKEDILLTSKAVEAFGMFDIELLDHIVVGKNKYISIRETNSDIFIRRNLL